MYLYRFLFGSDNVNKIYNHKFLKNVFKIARFKMISSTCFGNVLLSITKYVIKYGNECVLSNKITILVI